MFVQIISSFCFISFSIGGSIPIWTWSGKWQKDYWAARSGQHAGSSASAEKGPWKNTQMAEASRYQWIIGELCSFWTAPKGSLLSARRVGYWQCCCRCQLMLAGHLVHCLSVTNLFVTWTSAFTGEVSECRLWTLWSLMPNPYACSILNYVLGLRCWALISASLVQILIGRIFYIPRAHVIC